MTIKKLAFPRVFLKKIFRKKLFQGSGRPLKHIPSKRNFDGLYDPQNKCFIFIKDGQSLKNIKITLDKHVKRNNLF